MEISGRSLVCNDLQKDDGFETWNGKKTSLMMDWLGLGQTNFQQRETETANGNEGRS